MHSVVRWFHLCIPPAVWYQPVEASAVCLSIFTGFPRGRKTQRKATSMKGRQPGRPTKWVSARVDQWLRVDKTGFRFRIWEKWVHKDKLLGTLTVSVGGVRWLPAKGKAQRRRNWQEVADWLSSQ